MRGLENGYWSSSAGLGCGNALNHAGKHGQGNPQRIVLLHPLASGYAKAMAKRWISGKLPEGGQPLVR